MMAMAKAGSTASADYKDHIMDLANAPGEQIFPGELAKALDLIAAGTEIDYVGATAVELVGAGESAGNYQEIEFADGAYSTIGYR
jgi:branched-chain amino acid transport system substrate-binding protein